MDLRDRLHRVEGFDLAHDVFTDRRQPRVVERNARAGGDGSEWRDVEPEGEPQRPGEQRRSPDPREERGRKGRDAEPGGEPQRPGEQRRSPDPGEERGNDPTDTPVDLDDPRTD